jgi:hypothetical protein
MDEIKFSGDVIKQIKDFNHWNLTKEQESLVGKLILNEELRKSYKTYGLCKKCNTLRRNNSFCNYCSFQQNFNTWTSGNHNVDKFIQKAQLKSKNIYQIIEWIEYDKFEDIRYLAKGGFGTTYKAIWKDGPIIRWNYADNRWIRRGETKVALKCLHNSQDITTEFFKEVKYFIFF